MKQNTLLFEQVQQLLPPELRSQETIIRFIDAINDSYNRYEEEIAALQIPTPGTQAAHDTDMLHQTVNRLSSLLRDLNTGVLAEDEHRTIVLANTQLCEIFDSLSDPELLIGQNCAVVTELGKHSFKDPDTFLQRIDNVLQERVAVTGDILEMADGRTLLRDYTPIYLEGIYKGHFWTFTDITKEKDAKEKLKEYEYRFRLALERIGDNVWEHDFSTGNTYFSDKEGMLLGYDFETFTQNAQLWWSIIFEEDRWMLEENDRNYKWGKQHHHHMEYRMHHKDGSVRWILDRGVVIERDDQGKPLRIIGTHTDITERKLPEQALRLKEEKYRTIIANINLGLIEVDIEERIVFANQSFCEMSGYSFEELEGRAASAIFARGENLEMMQAKNNQRHKGLSDAYEIVIRNKRGQLRWWLISGAPHYNDKGELVGSIGIHLDITEQKQLEYDLIEASEQAEASAKAKEIFLANMSHEIRTPMNAILGMGRQLQKTDLDERQRFFLEHINNASENLLVVINDILDISKIEAGRLSVEHIGFRLENIISQTIQMMTHRAEEKELQLLYTIDPAIVPVLKGDPYRLSQVLLNLISNAIKFTENGTVRADCLLHSTEAHRQHIMIRISDTGIGIEAGFLDKVFEEFQQEYKSTARTYGGSGLGMAISKQLTELMGGSIRIESEKNKGTTVTLNIPFEKGEVADIPVRTVIEPDITFLKDKRILLVEDNEMNRLVATTVLDSYGASVTEAHHGAEAIKLLQVQPFDLVLMDVQMPVMDGLEATAIIRQSISPTLPVIALTANVVAGEIDKCMNAGMNAWIAKPFEEDVLIKLIADQLGMNGGNDKNEPLPENEELFDLTRLREISRGNDAFVQKMLHLFCEQAPASVAEMEEAFTEEDIGRIKAIAHRIKPGIDNLSITLLKDKIRLLENCTVEDAGSIWLGKLIGETAAIVELVVERIRSL